jgi:hypothetical protein
MSVNSSPKPVQSIQGSEFGCIDFTFDIYPDGDVVFQGVDNRFVQIDYSLLNALHAAARKARKEDAAAVAA